MGRGTQRRRGCARRTVGEGGPRSLHAGRVPARGTRPGAAQVDREPSARPAARGAARRDPGPAGPADREQRAAGGHAQGGARPDRHAQGGGRPPGAAAERLRRLPGRHEDGTVDVFTGGRKLRVAVSPSIEVDELRRGQEVLLNDALNIVDALGFERAGEVVMLKEILERRATGRWSSRTPTRSGSSTWPTPCIDAPLRAGDSLLIEPRSAYAYERIPKSEVEELVLEEVPDVDYSDIGGLRPADRADPRRGGAAVPARRAVPRAPAAPAEGRAALRPARLRQDADRQGGRQLAGEEDRRAAGRGEARPATSSTSRVRSCSTSTSARPSGTSG